jgi:glycerol-3-phosphate dehydrogenase
MSSCPSQIECDVLVVGGGINGVGIARDAAGRGLSVVLCEKDDLASHTSSASSKMIHGGLRYLEQYDFALVRKALREREVLLKCAPHIMRPLRLVMPHGRGQRPAWLIRAGLFLYDHLAKREFLPGSRAVALGCHPAGRALQAGFRCGFEYSDGWVDDARLVVLNALDARDRGACVLTRTRCEQVARGPGGWKASLQREDGARLEVSARCLVNAAGPWAAQFGRAAGVGGAAALRLVKGSHIVVPRLFEHGYGYLFQHEDGRVVFALPYEEQFTLIGTTDLDFQGDLDQVGIGADETAYLCALANRYFSRPLTPADVLWSFSGVRPLVEDASASASAATRDFRLQFDAGEAPSVTVLGGKITTYRKLAEQAVDWIGAQLGSRVPAWTAHACLPGGDLAGERPSARAVTGFDEWLRMLQAHVPWLPPALALRYGRAYGSRLSVLLAGMQGLADLGEEVLPGLYAAEIRYLMRHEFAQHAEDILWRRTKLGLHLPPGSAATLELWMERERHSQKQPVAQRCGQAAGAVAPVAFVQETGA